MGTTIAFQLGHKRTSKLRPVQVEWIDACEGEDEFRATVAADTPVQRVTSVGFLLTKNRERVVIASSQVNELDDDNPPVLDVLVIPRVNVRRVRRLKVA